LLRGHGRIRTKSGNARLIQVYGKGHRDAPRKRDYTARIVPRHLNALVPLEANPIIWQS
jgi:hypothetical protein